MPPESIWLCKKDCEIFSSSRFTLTGKYDIINTTKMKFGKGDDIDGIFIYLTHSHSCRDNRCDPGKTYCIAHLQMQALLQRISYQMVKGNRHQAFRQRIHAGMSALQNQGLVHRANKKQIIWQI